MNFSATDIELLVKKYYALDASAEALTGEYEFNFLVTTPGGAKYIFKAASDEHSYDFFDAQVKIVQHLSASEVAEKFFRYILNTEGKQITILNDGERKYYLRLLTFLPGTFWMHESRILQFLQLFYLPLL